MIQIFGPATGALVDKMSEEDCVAKCREKTKSFMGEAKAKVFDNL